MEKIDKAIEILQAFKEGKVIECNTFNRENQLEWLILNREEEIYSALHYGNTLRVVKEPTYRPYANAEEFLKASKEHGLIITDKCQYYLPVIYGKEGVKFESLITSYEDLLTYYVFEKDNTPCGILEQ